MSGTGPRRRPPLPSEVRKEEADVATAREEETEGMPAPRKKMRADGRAEEEEAQLRGRR
uniref:Uncharacterized protein n=1 Tax=Setaria italica TaxID=4555 RepID=K3ZGL3_SETIT